MRSLTHARQRARACRDTIGASADGLFECLRHYLSAAYEIELHSANQAFLQGGRAEVIPAEGCLFYDERLDDDPAAKLMVVLHEVGHLELHPRLHRRCTAPDPVYGSMYLNDGAPALARYNRRAREEAEANAFATEFLCPSPEVFQQWRGSPDDTAPRIAQRLGVPISVVQAQLAEALYQMVMGDDGAAPEKSQRPLAGDESQRVAATFTGGPALVNAGPGTGKTAALVWRIAYLLEELGADPETLLVLTFSNDAAEELRQRIAAQFGAATASRMEISTFHGFGVTFLYHHGQFLGVDADAAILDETGQEELVTSLLGTVPCGRIITLYNPEETVRDIVRHIGYLKDRLYQPEHLAAALHAWHPTPDERQQYEATGEFLEVYRAYEAAKTARQRVDFADLIALPTRILDANPSLVTQYRQKYRWVMVDEYQDVSRAVAALLCRLCGPENPPWVVGDTRQAIYRFRGAAPENVDQFAQDFPGARVFHLTQNYRSCAEIIGTANQLARVMEAPQDPSRDYPERWTAGTTLTALSTPAVAVARAPSDQAEQVGIADQVRAWLALDIPAREIAVLARRNVDVRNIVLALGQRGIQVTTSGLVTAEGAAGDLAAVATWVDQPGASLPRLAFSLGRGRSPVPVINAVLARALETLADDGTFATDGYGTGDVLAAEMERVGALLQAERFRGDAFTMLCVFLFDGSAYLRRILEQPEGAERALALSEIVTALSRAAGYRFTHPEATPWLSRKGFGQAFRAALCASAPCLIPPRPTAEAVRVMTCHASKGLEFPCVIVAGQTLSQAPRTFRWLPASLQPLVQEDAQQSDALFFVGVTRAQRACVVTYAHSASGTTHSRPRQVTPLLERWHTIHAPHTLDWPSQPAVRTWVTMGTVWGGSLPGVLAARLLDKDACALRTYLEHFLKARFPPSVSPLYPIFFATVRRAMERIVRQAHETGTPLSPDEAEAILRTGWPTREEVAAHPHHALYFNLARAYVARFASVYTPHPPMREHRTLTIGIREAGVLVSLDLVAHYQATDGVAVALAFRPESLAPHTSPQGVRWSGLDSAHRVPFVLLRQDDPGLQPSVFSAEDGVVYPYRWSARATDLAKEAERVTARLQALAQGRFETTVSEWVCDRCPVRVSCPYWLGALEDAPTTAPDAAPSPPRTHRSRSAASGNSPSPSG